MIISAGAAFLCNQISYKTNSTLQLLCYIPPFQPIDSKKTIMIAELIRKYYFTVLSRIFRLLVERASCPELIRFSVVLRSFAVIPL